MKASPGSRHRLRADLQLQRARDPQIDTTRACSISAPKFRTPLAPRGTPRYPAAARTAALVPQCRKCLPRRMTGIPYSTGVSAPSPQTSPSPVPEGSFNPRVQGSIPWWPTTKPQVRAGFVGSPAWGFVVCRLRVGSWGRTPRIRAGQAPGQVLHRPCADGTFQSSTFGVTRPSRLMTAGRAVPRLLAEAICLARTVTRCPRSPARSV